MDRIRVYGLRVRHLETIAQDKITVRQEAFVALQDKLFVLLHCIVLDIIIYSELSLLLGGEHENHLVKLHAKLSPNIFFDSWPISLT